MINKKEEAHNNYLDNLVNSLYSVGEDRSKVHWILKDGIVQDNGTNRRTLCDLILFYHNGTAVPIELKGSKSKIDKAMSQILSGKAFAEELHYKVDYGKFVVYGYGGYETTEVKFYDTGGRND
jgi:hypothetical protein